MTRVARRWWVWGGVVAGVVVLLGGLLAWWLWPAASTPAPRARQYRAVDVCLLTDAQGLAGTANASVWSGLQDASLATQVRVSYLPSTGTDVTQVLPYLASLLQRHCTVVVAVGSAQVGAVARDATSYPDVRFVVVGGGASFGNVTAVASGAKVRAQVDETVTGLVGR